MRARVEGREGRGAVLAGTAPGAAPAGTSPAPTATPAAPAGTSPAPTATPAPVGAGAGAGAGAAPSTAPRTSASTTPAGVVRTACDTRAAQWPQLSRCFSRDQASGSGRVPSP